MANNSDQFRSRNHQSDQNYGPGDRRGGGQQYGGYNKRYNNQGTRDRDRDRPRGERPRGSSKGKNKRRGDDVCHGWSLKEKAHSLYQYLVQHHPDDAQLYTEQNLETNWNEIFSKGGYTSSGHKMSEIWSRFKDTVRQKKSGAAHTSGSAPWEEGSSTGAQRREKWSNSPTSYTDLPWTESLAADSFSGQRWNETGNFSHNQDPTQSEYHHSGDQGWQTSPPLMMETSEYDSYNPRNTRSDKAKRLTDIDPGDLDIKFVQNVPDQTAEVQSDTQSKPPPIHPHYRHLATHPLQSAASGNVGQPTDVGLMSPAIPPSSYATDNNFSQHAVSLLSSPLGTQPAPGAHHVPPAMMSQPVHGIRPLLQFDPGNVVFPQQSVSSGNQIRLDTSVPPPNFTGTEPAHPSPEMPGPNIQTSTPSPQSSTTRPPVTLMKRPPTPNIKKPGTVKWLEYSEKTMGRFFINKVFVDKEKQTVWEPVHLKETETHILSFEDVVPPEDLHQAIIVDEVPFSVANNMIFSLPVSTKITYIAPGGDGTVDKGPFEEELFCCPEHGASVAGQNDQEPCSCVGKRSVHMIYPTEHSALRIKLYLLRYATHVRIVVPSSAFNRDAWNNFAQFGWFCDFPITEKESSCEEAENDGKERRQSLLRELFTLMEILGAHDAAQSVLQDADFTQVFDGIHLITSVPGKHLKSHLPDYGTEKLNRLQRGLCIPQTTETKYICQTHSIGSSPTVNQALNHIFNRQARYQQNMQVIYPSMTQVNNLVEKEMLTREEVDQGLKYYEQEKGLLISNLCDIDSPEVVPHANVYMEYYPLEEDGETHQYGWIATGSQRLSEGSWGRLQYNAVFKKYELGVFLGPVWNLITLEDGSVEVRFSAVDLGKIGLHFATPAPYSYSELPYMSSDEKEDFHFYRCIGKLVRIAQGKMAFMDEIYGHQKLTSQFEHYPDKAVTTRHRAGDKCAALPIDMCFYYGERSFPAVGSILEFYGTAIEQGKFRVYKILQIYNSISDAYTAHGIPMGDSSQRHTELDWGMERLWLKKPGKASISDIMKENNIETEEDFYDYWAKKNNHVKTHDPWNYRPSEDYSLLNDPRLEPWKVTEHMVWLEKHVSRRVGGRGVDTKGPYDLSHLTKIVEAHRWKHYNVETAVEG